MGCSWGSVRSTSEKQASKFSSIRFFSPCPTRLRGSALLCCTPAATRQKFRQHEQPHSDLLHTSSSGAPRKVILLQPDSLPVQKFLPFLFFSFSIEIIERSFSAPHDPPLLRFRLQTAVDRYVCHSTPSSVHVQTISTGLQAKRCISSLWALLQVLLFLQTHRKWQCVRNHFCRWPRNRLAKVQSWQILNFRPRAQDQT